MVQDIAEMVTLVSVRQKEPLGLGHAILCAKKVVGNEPFAVLLGDDLIDAKIPCIRQMMDVYQKMDGALLAIQKVRRTETHLYGIIKGKKVKDRIYNLAIIGRYILPPQIFDILERIPPDGRGEIQLTEGLRELKKTVPIFGYEFFGDRYDAGDKLGYLQANISYGLKHPELGPKLKHYLKNIKL